MDAENKPPKPPASPVPKAAAKDRETRLAAALRANLRRRKTGAKADDPEGSGA
ncbi:MAG: hypothetical protein ABI376_05275 [Caulobacteraceae bacterium]